ncbi:uroporphyrinogen-III synthase [Ramlibacter sp. G-1-2-2]|uniref:Uroporphyrinogen-III synthase n=1 Tax=Ramlibacter agri TaxID=2728837 RepID=A0A848HA75_9BURK|nr:uroporphyrinogen-III synthase [Ramlibacter agri]NML46922.1 uroporphyrinogen-III synthase [Ramlibacter agri]
MRIVVTRPAQEAARWVQQLRACGHEAVALPLMAIHPAPDPQALDAARAALAQYAAVMFVSGNAVQGLLAEGMAWPRGVRAWAPGPATRELLLRSGVPFDAIDAPAEDAPQFDSESLWDRVQGQLQRSQRLLLVRGAGADGRSRGRDWLAQQLAAAGVQVDEVAAYARGLPAWSVAEQDVARQASGDGSLWLFSSSEAAANLGELLPAQDWAAARALVTHPRIAAAVRVLGFGYVQESRPALAEVMASIESSR